MFHEELIVESRFLIKYFCYIYGEKFIVFKKLAYIYKLESNLTDDNSKIKLVKLVYSLSLHGTKRKITLEKN